MPRKIFNNDERQLVKELVTSKLSVLESTKTDGVPLKVKAEVWSGITHEFNAVTGDNATTKQIRKLWDNMKNLSKKALAAERRERMSTGGGPGPSRVEPNIIIDVSDFIVSDVEGAYDSDTLYLAKGNTNPSPSEIIFEESENGATEISDLVTNNETGKQPSLNIQSATQTHQSSTPASQYVAKRKVFNAVDEEKIKLIKLQADLLLKESEEFMRYLKIKQEMEKAEHSKKMELMDLEVKKLKRGLEL